MQLPVYVINLDKRPDRWASISDNLQRIGVRAERVDAVDAETLAYLHEDESIYGGAPPRRIDFGAFACILSHGKAMKRLLASGAPAALILEDDAELASDTGTLLRDKGWWPARTSAIQLHEQMGVPGRLGGVSGRTPGGREMRRAARWAGCAAAYLIDREGARAVLSIVEDPPHPIDHILFDLRESRTARRLRPMQIVPAMARQRYGVEESDLEHWRREARATRDIASRLHRLQSNLRRMPYGAWLRGLSALGRVRRVEVSYRDV